MSRKELILSFVVIFLMGVMFGVYISCAVYMGQAHAEDILTYKCWAVCQPESEVILREKPNKKSGESGAVECGGLMRTDFQEKNGWLHIVEADNETGEGWIFEGYVVFEEPQIMNCEMKVVNCRRVACRKCIDGKISKWASKGSIVFVYLRTSEWSITSKGYIRSEYLEETD